MVPVIGVEPIRYHYHGILSPARLPIPPHRQIFYLRFSFQFAILLYEQNIIEIALAYFYSNIISQSFLFCNKFTLKKERKMKKLILIDGNSLINRAFYATPPMSNSKGVQTNAVLGFVNMLMHLSLEEKPDYMLVAFDRKEPTFRHQMYAEYKGTRKPMPDDLRPQIVLLKEVLAAMGVCCFELAGSEADDIIGTASRKFNVENIIVTGDKDSFQLVNDNTTVYFTRRGISDIDVLNAQNFHEKTSVDPLQIIDLKALMGDKSDNIPGIVGIGEKTALGLINEFGSVENLYENLDSVSGKLHQKIADNKDMCFLSKKLATIDLNVNMPLELEDLKFSMPLPISAKQIFADLEFRTLLKRSELFVSPSEEKQESFETAFVPEIINIKDSEDLKKINNDVFSFYYSESKNKESFFALSDGIAEYRIKIKEDFFGEGLTYDEAVRLVRPLFEDTSKTAILFSSKQVAHMLDEFDIKMNCRIEDVSIQKYIVNFTGTEETLEDVILAYKLPEATCAYSLFTLNKILHALLEENGQLDLYYDIELPLANVLFEMEKAGFRVDVDILKELNEKYKREINELSNKIYELAGETFNINSPKQLSHILFEKLGLYKGKKKKVSTSAEVLEEIYDDHEIVPYILRYRHVSKLNSTYVEGFLPQIDKRTGMIHTVFNQTLTSTGRLSSKEPNLQNLPIRDEEGKEIRRFFVPSDSDHVLVGADYSQIELRLLAHFSGCEKLVEAYQRGEDIHALTASQVFGVDIKDVTKKMRRDAKAVNFGIIYGISEYGLAKNVKISPREAKAYIDRYFEGYPNVKEYMDQNVSFAHQNGYVSTLCGRKRYIRDINSSNYNLRSFSERAAMNMPLQGSSADIIKIAMIHVYNRLKENGLKSRLILQVHDELIIDTVISEQPLVEKILKEEMENAVTLRVPLVAEVYSGKNLSEAK